MKRVINATLGFGTAALLSLTACGGGGGDQTDTGMAADTGLGATVPAPAPAPMDTMRDTMAADTTADTTMRDTGTATPPPPSN